MKRPILNLSMGFTLIELMVTVAIIGILASIAYPSYTEYVLRANRAEVKSILLENAQILERNFTTANRYDKDSAGNALNLITQSPQEGTAKYTIDPGFGAEPSQSFTLTATAVGTMASDSCGNFTLTNTGVRGAAGVTTGAKIETCWGK